MTPKKIINENAIKILNYPVYEPIKTLLLKYGVCLEIDLSIL